MVFWWYLLKNLKHDHWRVWNDTDTQRIQKMIPVGWNGGYNTIYISIEEREVSLL